MENRPLLSIVIPTLNRASSIISLVNSIGHKDDNCLEIVITDDCSTPDEFDRLKNFCLNHSNIVLHKNPKNLGMVKNWNECVLRAQGQWICFMCDDDLFHPDGVARIIELINKKYEACLILQSPEIEEEIKFCKPGIETVKRLKLPLVSGNIWHRDITDNLGVFDERIKYSPDATFWNKIALNYPVIKIKKPFASYVSHENNYAYSTWVENDFLDQVSLICNINALNLYGKEGVLPTLIIDEIERAKDETIFTILNTTCLDKSKKKIFWRYYKIGVERQEGFAFAFRLFVIRIILKKIISKTKLQIKNVYENI